MEKKNKQGRNVVKELTACSLKCQLSFKLKKQKCESIAIDNNERPHVSLQLKYLILIDEKTVRNKSHGLKLIPKTC